MKPGDIVTTYDSVDLYGEMYVGLSRQDSHPRHRDAIQPCDLVTIIAVHGRQLLVLTKNNVVGWTWATFFDDPEGVF